ALDQPGTMAPMISSSSATRLCDIVYCLQGTDQDCHFPMEEWVPKSTSTYSKGQ
ncbi:hypothetical protein NDU88_011598, partial [Pleurodeles waltl]